VSVSLTIRAVAQSDVGLVRQGNEDSGYAGPRLLVVADGMGGHAAGEVASAVAVEALAELDGPGPAPSDLDVQQALTDAIRRANERIRDLVEADPRRAGMGTTVTALLWTGGGFELAHIGDSRAYLLRDGELTQLTRDHTYVQALIDEGRISESERETHPARSLILQALGGDEVSPDLTEVSAREGDRMLVCSDGLSGVVVAQTLRDVLAEERDPQVAAGRLIALAVQGGGPDNITAVIADISASGYEPQADDTTEAHLVGAAAIGAAHPDALRYDEDAPGDEPDASVATAPPSPEATSEAAEEEVEQQRYAPRRRSRWRWTAVVVVLAVLGAAAVLVGRAALVWYEQQYYVGVEGDAVAIRAGVPGVPGSSVVVTVPDLPVAALPEIYQEDVRQGIRADDFGEAEEIVQRVRREACRVSSAASASRVPGLNCTRVLVTP
jgi:protein phosphatase